MFEPLYPGATLTVCGAFCVIMQFCIANKLPYTGITDLLKLLSLLCPSPNQIPSSVYILKKFFEHFRPSHKHNKICIDCQSAFVIIKSTSQKLTLCILT